MRHHLWSGAQAAGIGDRAHRVVFVVWRDTSHPEGGGSEVYVENIARRLVEQGRSVTILCAAHDRADRDETREGIRFRRRGGRLTVYPRALAYLVRPVGRAADVVVDVQNGLPFWTPLVRRRPIVALIHHVHQEQWQTIYPGWRGRLGWWLESVVAPRLYRRCAYVTVSEPTSDDLAGLGIAHDRIAIVHNGLDAHLCAAPEPAAQPTLACLARLVPHKRIEHAIEAVARLKVSFPGLRLDIIGEGWWRESLETAARAAGVADAVTFHGYLDAADRDAVLRRAWLHLMPSAKEGWGLAVVEAAALGVPSVAYSSAGGVRESIVDGVTGAIVDDFDDFVAYTGKLLADPTLRQDLAMRAQQHAQSFNWDRSAERFATALDRAQSRR
jgi:glycosyltransferase involved in cell wall biosynthesis